MKRISSILLTAMLCGLAYAAPTPAGQYPWPTTHTRVRLVAVPVECGWRDGRPFASRSDVARILHLPDEGSSSVDLIEALAEKGWTVHADRDGTLIASPPVQAKTAATEPLVVRESDESRRAVAAFARICASENVRWLKDDPRQPLVDAVGGELALQARRPIPWTFAIVQSNEPNAACTGEGMVYITTALLNIIDKDELAGILGHEVAHGAQQHLAEDRHEDTKIDQTGRDLDRAEAIYRQAQERARERYYSELENGVHPDTAERNLQQALADANSRMRRSLQTIDQRINAHQSYKQHKPQTDERQADLVGMKYAIAAGYRPDGLLRALEKLQARKFRNYGQRKMLGSRTHPPLHERIKALGELVKKPEFQRSGW